MIVRAPGSSANLGPGFDCLGLAIDVPFDVSDTRLDTFHAVEPGHPARRGYVEAGGDPGIALWWRSPFPPGRGQGFSGAARVAGAFLALEHAGTAAGADPEVARRRAFGVAAALEGHADNAAASTWGGFTVATPDRALRVPVPPEVALVMWWPARRTSTASSRGALPGAVPFPDAVGNVAHASLMVAALGTGNWDAVGSAVLDRLHQDRRLDAQPRSREVLALVRGIPHVYGAWLSGSGPTIAALVPVAEAERVAATLAGLVGVTRGGDDPRSAGDEAGERVSVRAIADDGVRALG
ncbi:MAG: hypothetical protein R2698_14220 [Microthrixaceae bacterium]